MNIILSALLPILTTILEKELPLILNISKNGSSAFVDLLVKLEQDTMPLVSMVIDQEGRTIISHFLGSPVAKAPLGSFGMSSRPGAPQSG